MLAMWGAMGTAAAADGSRWLIENRDADTDGDGLSDVAEVHKYFTDPALADTDGDGVPDGDWGERREYAYTVRDVLELLEPFDLAAMQTDLQDARLVSTGRRSDVVEVVAYPFTTRPDPTEPGPVDPAYLAPSRTIDWDDPMRVEPIAALRADGIDVDGLSQRELVERVSRWVDSAAFPNEAPFVAYAVDFTGAPTLRDGFRPLAPGAPSDPAALAAYVQSGVLGKAMFEQRARGSCTPTAILMATVLRALGVPARLVLTVPPVDPNDRAQRRSVDRLQNPYVRSAIARGVDELRGWVGHSYDEVYVDGRWTKLNGATLGQNNLDPAYLGLMIQVNTFVDWADGGMTDTWGARQLDALHGRLDPPMSSENQYRSLELSDAVGPHADPAHLWRPGVPGRDTATPVESRLGGPGRRARANSVRWLDDPPPIGETDWAAQLRDHGVALGEGRGFLLGVAGDGRRFRSFAESAPGGFSLVAEGRPAVRATLRPWGLSTDHQGVFLVWVDPDDAAALEPGARYRVVAAGPAWVVPEDLSLVP